MIQRSAQTDLAPVAGHGLDPPEQTLALAVSWAYLVYCFSHKHLHIAGLPQTSCRLYRLFCTLLKAKHNAKQKINQFHSLKQLYNLHSSIFLSPK